MIVKIVNRFWIEAETTREIAELMIKRGEISTYETPEGATVEWEAEPVTFPVTKAKNITRKPKI